MACHQIGNAIVCTSDRFGSFFIRGPGGKPFVIDWEFHNFLGPSFAVRGHEDDYDLSGIDGRFARKVWRRWEREFSRLNPKKSLAWHRENRRDFKCMKRILSSKGDAQPL